MSGGVLSPAASDVSRAAAALAHWAAVCAAASLSEGLTYPLDTVKTRLQLQHERGLNHAGARASTPPLGMLAMLRHMVATEGRTAPFAGASVAIVRQWFNAGVSVGLYPWVRRHLLAEGETADRAPTWKRAVAGAVTGSIGQTLAQPFDVIKTRLQADGRRRAQRLPPVYAGPADAVARVWAADGAAGFYAALGSSVWRAAIINAAGIASYDATKQWAVRVVGRGDRDAFAPQVVAAAVCGVVSTVVSCPLDVVKTRLLTNAAAYRGPTDCLIQLLRTEGARGMWKGFVPTYQRQAIWNGVFWLALEQLQRATGMPRL